MIISGNLGLTLKETLAECGYDRLFVLCDDTTARLCLPVLRRTEAVGDASVITISSGDESKTLDSLQHVWGELQRMGATRHSLMINLGGGMVTDLGGFAASTFKRGIKFINIPTTLLAMVDASVGGKTGINFGGLKNEVGVFRNAASVILHTAFLATLDRQNLLSGFAEMLKHGLISTASHWSDLLRFGETSLLNCQTLEETGLNSLAELISESVSVKQRVVLEDPEEHGLRKALNLGHTFGHAFESLALKRKPVLHGYAVAWGLVCELYLSHMKVGFPLERLRQAVSFIEENYGRMSITCDDYPELLELMTHDKKNTAGVINFSLLSDIGELRLNQTATNGEIEEALDFYREGQ